MNDPLVVDEFCKTLTLVERNTGLKVSFEKTTIYRVGSLAKSCAKLYTAREMNWSNEPIETLGVKLACDGNDDLNSNYAEVLQKMKGVCENWENRKLSLSGKILLINSLMGSLFVYKMMVMIELTESQIHEFEKIIHEFLSGKKRACIAIATLHKSREQGGLRLIDIRSKAKVLLTSWIFKLPNDSFLAETAYRNLSPLLHQLIWKCNLKPKDVKRLFTEQTMWTKMLSAWAEINYSEPQTCEQMLGEFIWYNSNLVCSNKPFLLNNWFQNGILFIEDLIVDNHFKTYVELCNEFGALGWLEYYQVISSFHPLWKLWIVDHAHQIGENISLYNTVEKRKNVIRFLYDKFIFDASIITKYANRWYKEGIDFDHGKYDRAFCNITKNAKATKYRDFQYCLLLCKLVTNQDLAMWGVQDSAICTFCETEVETIVHILYECEKLRPLIEIVHEMCINNNLTVNISLENFLLNCMHDNAYHIVNLITLIIKQYIYRNRCAKTRITRIACEREITMVQKLEYFNATRTGKLLKHVKKWSPVYPELCELLEVPGTTSEVI